MRKEKDNFNETKANKGELCGYEKVLHIFFGMSLICTVVGPSSNRSILHTFYLDVVFCGSERINTLAEFLFHFIADSVFFLSPLPLLPPVDLPSKRYTTTNECMRIDNGKRNRTELNVTDQYQATTYHIN